MALKVVGSNPIIHPIKTTGTLWVPVIFMDNGIRKAVKKTCRWHVFRPWENPWKADGTPQGVLAAFHLSVHPSAGLCIVSTYDTFARKERHPFGCLFFLGWIMGFERAA